MFNYPFFGFKNRTYPYKYYNFPNFRNRYTPNYNEYHQAPTSKAMEKAYIANRSSSITQEIPSSKSETSESRNNEKNEQFFSILGIHLYFDDLIILSLLFFLYNERVKDEGLFICLILLLLS